MPYSDLYYKIHYQKAKYLSEGNWNFQIVYCLDYVKWKSECFLRLWTKDCGGKKWTVDLTYQLRLHKGLIKSWKLCLNLCSRKWIKPKQSLVIRFYAFRITRDIHRIRGWWYELHHVLLKNKHSANIEG